MLHLHWSIMFQEGAEESLRKQFASERKIVLPKQVSELSDSNIITPGTEFMQILSRESKKIHQSADEGESSLGKC